MMRTIATTALLLVLSGLAGCGGGDAPVTDPSQLTPLTEEQLREIERQDALIEEDEMTGGVGNPG